MPDTTQIMNQMLNAYGVTNASGGLNWPNLMGGVLFGIIGFSAFMYGKKERNVKALAIGIILMVYPWVIPNTIAIYVVGTILTAALFFWRD